jgi:formylglycine-generating enzyme required for sulfatase activity
MRTANRSGALRLLAPFTGFVIILAQPVSADKSLCAETSLKALTNTVGMVFIYVPPGSFLMGSPPDEAGRDLDESQHEITLSEGFYLQETEVTQAQWKAVMGDNPSMMKNPDYPATNISWDNALAFIQQLNQPEGTDAYRLPGEAEWEWACRAGSPSGFPAGAVLSTDQANYDGNHPYNGYEKGVFRRGIVKTGAFQPNPWGLYDMSGNVWEWCQDAYGPYPSTAETDPVGPSQGLFKVVRGGSWYYDIQSCRCASRHKADPSKESILIGFRVAKSLQ